MNPEGEKPNPKPDTEGENQAQELSNENQQLETENIELKNRIKELKKQLMLAHQETEEYKSKAMTNGLTGVFTRRYFFDGFLDKETEAIKYRDEAERRGKEPANTVSIIMLDIDNFKKINDKHGHPGGDKVLKEIAQRIQKSIRRQDVLARYGGEEFIIGLPGAQEQEAFDIAQRIRKTIERGNINNILVTASLGVSEMKDPNEKPDDFIKRADQALYKSKKSGRNIVTKFSDLEKKKPETPKDEIPKKIKLEW